MFKIKDKHKEHIEKIVKPIWEKALQETIPNPSLVVGVDNPKVIKFLWQPHNYRIYFNFEKINFKVVTPSVYKYPSFKHKLVNHNSEHHFENFESCRIIIKKNLAEVINKSHNKQWRLITANSIGDVDKRINEVISKLNNQGINALKRLISLCGGISDCKILKVRAEHGIHGIDYLDRIPEDMIIHDTVFKKQYKKKPEFYEVAHVKNVVTNNAINDIAPDIADSINVLGSKFDKFMDVFLPVQKDFAANIKTHTKVLKGIDKSFKKFNNLLSQKQLSQWQNQ